MEVLQARIDSFKKSKRVKNPNKPSSTVTLKWPHPPDFKANPETLADAGFFYNPSYEGPDSVTCYVCDKELEGWEDDDDPHAIHWKKCGQKCCWAAVRCGLLNDMDKSNRFVFTDKTRLPTHKVMEKARFDTFGVGKGWIHDQVKNHGASSKMMARAGFVYTPQQRNDDLVTCLYCDTSLSGWDAGDDPMAEHRKRKKLCPFFSATVSEPAAPANRAKSSKSKAPTRSTSKSKHQDILLPTKTHDGDPDNDSDSSQSVTTAKAAAKTPRKGRLTRKPSAKTPKSKRSISRSKAEDSEDIPMKKSSRSKANASEDQKIPTKHSRTRSKAKIIESEPEEPLSSPAPTRQKMKVVEVSSDEEEPETTTVFPARKIDVEPEMAPTSQRVLKKVTTSLPKTAPSAAEPETVNEITSIPPVSPIREIDTEPEMVHPAPTPPMKVMTSPLKPVLSAVVELETVNETASVPTVSPIREVVMGHIEPKPEMVYPAPPTPQRPLPQTLPRTVITPTPKTVAVTAAVPTVSPIREIDVVMGDIEPEPEMVYPSTPQRALPQTPPKVINPPLKTVQSTAVEVIPALSKLPITPFHTLTEAELDMTVEEWVRYQMDVEYDKFRRDGERELQRFRKQAEEVRKAIEGL